MADPKTPKKTDAPKPKVTTRTADEILAEAAKASSKAEANEPKAASALPFKADPPKITDSPAIRAMEATAPKKERKPRQAKRIADATPSEDGDGLGSALGSFAAKVKREARTEFGKELAELKEQHKKALAEAYEAGKKDGAEAARKALLKEIKSR